MKGFVGMVDLNGHVNNSSVIVLIAQCIFFQDQEDSRISCAETDQVSITVSPTVTKSTGGDRVTPGAASLTSKTNSTAGGKQIVFEPDQRVSITVSGFISMI